MDIEEFGRRLIETGDLDPVYVALRGAELPEPQLCRLLLAYWCFYSLGAAAYISEANEGRYWSLMLQAAENDTPPPTGLRWPRSAERRHFRGPKCVDAVRRLTVLSPEDRVRGLAVLGTERLIMDEVKRWYLFGDWVSFKAADMLERVYGAPVTFSADTILMYEEPRRALDLFEEGAYARFLEHFAQYQAPPSGDRACGPQEVETVLCKFKSMLGGHYAVGKDIREVRHGLVGWGDTAARLLASCPEEVEA